MNCLMLFLVAVSSLSGLQARSAILDIEPKLGSYRAFADEYRPMLKHEGVDFCTTCVNFASQAINQLLNIILNGGVIAGCSDLCGTLANKTGSQTLGVVCNMICDIAGFEAFTKIIEQADLDPIYYCQLLKVCPINDNADASFKSAAVTPKSGPVGTRFSLQANYTSVHGTGPGEIALIIDTLDNIPVESVQVKNAAAAGNYTINGSVLARPDPDCDPTQDFCEQWRPGVYTFNLLVCNGECGSKHPHSKLLADVKVNFTITG